MEMLCASRSLLWLCGDGPTFLFLTGFVCLLLFPDIVLVISYNLLMLRCPDAFSASVAMSI